MLSLRQLIRQAAALLQKHPRLWTPPLAVALLTLLLVPAGRGPGTVLAIVTSLIALVVSVGWYAMIGQADDGEVPTWDRFFETIGRTFPQLVLGSLVQGGVSLLGVVPILLATGFWIGGSTLERLGKELDGMQNAIAKDPTALLTMDPVLVQALLHVLTGLSLAAVWVGIVWFVLQFWQQALSQREISWRDAWGQSGTLIRTHFGYVTGLVTIQGLAFVVAFGLSASSGIAGVVGWILLLGVNAMTGVTLTLCYRQGVPASTTTSNPDAPRAPVN